MNLPNDTNAEASALGNIANTSWPTMPAEPILESLCLPPDEKPSEITDELDQWLRIMARLIVLAIGSFILFGMFLIVFFNDSSPTRSLLDSLHMLSDEWKSLLIIVIPVFYLPIRRLIYRARSFGAGHAGPSDQQNNPQTYAPAKPGTAGAA